MTDALEMIQEGNSNHRSMSETTQSTEDVLTEIAQAIKEHGSYELTDEDETRRALGLPSEDDYKHPIGDYDADLVATGSRNSLPVTERVYRLPSGDYTYIRETTKNQGEYHTRYYVKAVGSPEIVGKGLDREKFRKAYEREREKGLEVDGVEIREFEEEIFEATDEFQRETAKIDIDHIGDGVGAVTDGSRVYMQHADESRFFEFDHRVSDELDLNEDEVRVVREAMLASTKHDTGHRQFDTDLWTEYVAEIEYDSSSLLED